MQFFRVYVCLSFGAVMCLDVNYLTTVYLFNFMLIYCLQVSVFIVMYLSSVCFYILFFAFHK